MEAILVCLSWFLTHRVCGHAEGLLFLPTEVRVVVPGTLSHSLGRECGKAVWQGSSMTSKPSLVSGLEHRTDSRNSLEGQLEGRAYLRLCFSKKSLQQNPGQSGGQRLERVEKLTEAFSDSFRRHSLRRAWLWEL